MCLEHDLFIYLFILRIQNVIPQEPSCYIYTHYSHTVFVLLLKVQYNILGNRLIFLLPTVTSEDWYRSNV